MDNILWILLFTIPALIIYLVPSIVAKMRKHKKVNEIIIVNVFLGWTFFGWVGALIWAVWDKE